MAHKQTMYIFWSKTQIIIVELWKKKKKKNCVGGEAFIY